MAGSFWMTALAIGAQSVKQYNIVLTLIDLCTVPLAYYLFTLGFNPVYAFIGKFTTAMIMQIYRLYFINKKVKFNRSEFVSYLFNVVVIFTLMLSLIYLSDTERTYSFMAFIGGAFILEIILIAVIMLFGLNRQEKNLIFSYINQRVRK